MSNFVESFDCRVWASAFKAHVEANPSIATDEGTLQAWFANALMRGYDERARQYDTHKLVCAVGRYDYDAEHREHLGRASNRIVEEALTLCRPHVDTDGIALDVAAELRDANGVHLGDHARTEPQFPIRPDGPHASNHDAREPVK